uniref:Uncharacterized protein n=1 Tax=Panagrolaimus superbus TaxID=310955 RepID=A0A914XYX4_9BILA
MTLDLMHDVLEGCAKYLMLYVLKTLPLNELNDAWSLFPFKRNDKSNASMSFTIAQLQKDQLTGLTSSMMLTLIRFLPLVVKESDVTISTKTPWWSIYMDFLTLMDILMAQSYTEERLVDLQNRAESYLERYQRAGGHMTVKSHFLLHEADVIRQMGPLRWSWCMRYEAAHRPIKQYAVVNRNHQNVAMTYAEKIQHSKMNLYQSMNESKLLIAFFDGSL